MYDLVIKNAKLIDDSVTDIAISNGKIAAIEKAIGTDSAKKTLDLAERFYVSSGWLDAHTHCFARSPIYHDEPDMIGVNAGVTSVVDAGSVGANNIDEFYKISQQVTTHVYSFLNVSKIGLIRQSELSDINDVDEKLFIESANRYPEFIIGIKIRISKSVVGENGIKPLLIAKEIQKKVPLPLMVHVGNNPPELDEIADALTKGDIITHCFNGKPNQIFDKNGQLKDSVRRAIDRGVILDIGHGGESFSFSVAERAKNMDIYPNTISSDIYSKNRINGPVFSLANVMTKFLCLGYSKQRIINSVTKNAAEILNIKTKGQLLTGFDADLTIFTIKQEQQQMSDAEGETRTSFEKFVPVAAVLAGNVVVTKEGKENDFSL